MVPQRRGSLIDRLRFGVAFHERDFGLLSSFAVNNGGEYLEQPISQANDHAVGEVGHGITPGLQATSTAVKSRRLELAHRTIDGTFCYLAQVDGNLRPRGMTEKLDLGTTVDAHDDVRRIGAIGDHRPKLCLDRAATVADRRLFIHNDVGLGNTMVAHELRGFLGSGERLSFSAAARGRLVAKGPDTVADFLAGHCSNLPGYDRRRAGALEIDGIVRGGEPSPGGGLPVAQKALRLLGVGRFDTCQP